MIETLNTAMVELQGALTARALYPPSHPRIRTGEERAYRLIQQVTQELPEVSFFAVGERVIYEGVTLPASATLSTTLFRALHASGVTRITFRRGVHEEELRSLLDDLADEAKRSVLKGTAHIGLGFVQERESPATDKLAVPLPGYAPLPTDLTSVLRGVWQEVQQGRRIHVDILGDMFMTLSKSLADSRSAMLPLATVKKHDEYTFVHTINVAMLSTALGEALGFKERLAHELNLAALLHDLGKELVPPELLNKSGRYTDEEFRVVQRHPVDGARMLLATPGVPELAPIVAYEHHVRADGTGYPRMPRGWRLNLASRIVQVADVFDALRTHRPYRPAMPLAKIVDLMRKDVGVLFDGDLLEIFLRQVVSRGIPLPDGVAD